MARRKRAIFTKVVLYAYTEDCTVIAKTAGVINVTEVAREYLRKGLEESWGRLGGDCMIEMGQMNAESRKASNRSTRDFDVLNCQDLERW